MSSSTFSRRGLAIHVAVLGASVVLFATMSDAARNYEFVFDQTDYIVQTNSSLTINVALRETATDGDVARLAPNGDDGLSEVTFRVDFGANALLSIAEDKISINPSLNPVLGEFLTDFSPTVGLFSMFGESDDLDQGLGGTELGPGIYQVDVASFTFQTGNQEGFVDLALQQDDGSTEVARFADDFVGDVTLPTTRITVTAVPEPASLAILGMTSFGFLARRKRRR